MTESLHAVRLRVNGAVHDVALPARRLLSDALRHDLRLTGTHVGCEHGVCGACTVLVEQGRPTDADPVRGSVDAAIEPEDDIHASADYRRHLAHVLVRRALTEAGERVA